VTAFRRRRRPVDIRYAVCNGGKSGAWGVRENGPATPTVRPHAVVAFALSLTAVERVDGAAAATVVVGESADRVASRGA
jgi:hypothetical protein